MSNETKPSVEALTAPALLQAIEIAFDSARASGNDSILRALRSILDCARELSASTPANAPAATGDAVRQTLQENIERAENIQWDCDHFWDGVKEPVRAMDSRILVIKTVAQDLAASLANLSADKASGEQGSQTRCGEGAEMTAFDPTPERFGALAQEVDARWISVERIANALRAAADLAREVAELRENLRVVNEQKVHEGRRWSEHYESQLGAANERIAAQDALLARIWRSARPNCEYHETDDELPGIVHTEFVANERLRAKVAAQGAELAPLREKLERANICVMKHAEREQELIAELAALKRNAQEGET